MAESGLDRGGAMIVIALERFVGEMRRSISGEVE